MRLTKLVIPHSVCSRCSFCQNICMRRLGCPQSIWNTGSIGNSILLLPGLNVNWLKLLRSGSNPISANNSGNTPLHYACFYRLEAIARVSVLKPWFTRTMLVIAGPRRALGNNKCIWSVPAWILWSHGKSTASVSYWESKSTEQGSISLEKFGCFSC